MILKCAFILTYCPDVQMWHTCIHAVGGIVVSLALFHMMIGSHLTSLFGAFNLK